MGSPLAPVLANIIMTELEKTFVQILSTSGMIKFCCRYDDDAFFLVKPADIYCTYTIYLINFIKTYSVDRFENELSHFVDLKISPLGLKI